MSNVDEGDDALIQLMRADLLPGEGELDIDVGTDLDPLDLSPEDSMPPPTPEELTDIFQEVVGLGEGETLGAMIIVNFPNDLHFVCGCANFDPFGHNEILRDIAFHFFLDKIRAKQSYKARACMMDVLRAADQKAKDQAHNQEAKFRIWKPNLQDNKRLNERNWESAAFEEITDNEGNLKKNLEWPMRLAIKKAEKYVEESQGASASMNGTDHEQTVPPTSGDGLNVDAPFTSSAPVVVVPPSPPIVAPTIIPETIFSRANPGDQRAKRNRPELATPETKMEWFVSEYESPKIQAALGRLDKDRGTQNIEEWAKQFYQKFRDEPENEHYIKLNMDRKTCLNLPYDMVREWEKYSFSEEFEKAMADVFKTRRLTRILAICLPMDRAQSLYKMRNATNSTYGIPWYSQLHVETAYAFDSPEEQKEWLDYLDSRPGPPSSPSMNKKLFRLLYSNLLGLKEIDEFKRWSQPARVPTSDEE